MSTTSFTNLITLTDAAWFNNADKAAYGYLTGVAGTNTITATGPASLSAYAAGNKFHFVPAATNTGATTINITQSGASALGAKNVFFNGAACVGGEIKIGVPCLIIYDGTQFQLVESALDKTAPTCGRLTLTTALPVTTADVTGATTVYFTPYKGNVVSLYDGAAWVSTVFTELSQTTADNTKSPAAVANNSNYDIFVWNDAGTLRATRGPAWTSDTARGAGAGTTELEMLEGRYVNKIAITNGPAARRGLYVGTIRSNGIAQINDALTARHVWNNYNRVMRPMRAVDTTDTWTYTTDTFRQANAAAANQVDAVFGLSEDVVAVEVRINANGTGAAYATPGIGISNTVTQAAQIVQPAFLNSTNVPMLGAAKYRGFPGIGRYYFVWLERSTASGITTWRGDGGDSTQTQSGISGEIFA